LEFVTPKQPHSLTVYVTLQFDNAEPFNISPEKRMYEYEVDPAVSGVEPKTTIVR